MFRGMAHVARGTRPTAPLVVAAHQRTPWRSSPMVPISPSLRRSPSRRHSPWTSLSQPRTHMVSTCALRVLSPPCSTVARARAWKTHERRHRSPKCSVTSCSGEDDRSTRNQPTSETRGGPESGSLHLRCMTCSVNVVGAIRTDVGVRQWVGCRDHYAVEIFSACKPGRSLQCNVRCNRSLQIL